MVVIMNDHMAQVCVRRMMWHQMEDENTNVLNDGGKFLIWKDHCLCSMSEIISKRNETAASSGPSFVGKHLYLQVRRG